MVVQTMDWRRIVKRLESTGALVISIGVWVIAYVLAEIWPGWFTEALVIATLVVYAVIVVLQLQPIEWSKAYGRQALLSLHSIMMRFEMFIGLSLALGSALIFAMVLSNTINTFIGTPVPGNLVSIVLAGGTFFMYYLSKCYLRDRLAYYQQFLPKESGET